MCRNGGFLGCRPAVHCISSSASRTRHLAHGLCRKSRPNFLFHAGARSEHARPNAGRTEIDREREREILRERLREKRFMCSTCALRAHTPKLYPQDIQCARWPPRMSRPCARLERSRSAVTSTPWQAGCDKPALGLHASAKRAHHLPRVRSRRAQRQTASASNAPAYRDT